MVIRSAACLHVFLFLQTPAPLIFIQAEGTAWSRALIIYYAAEKKNFKYYYSIFLLNNFKNNQLEYVLQSIFCSQKSFSSVHFQTFRIIFLTVALALSVTIYFWHKSGCTSASEKKSIEF